MTQTTQEISKSGRPIFGDSMAPTEEAAFPRLTSAELALVRPLAKPCDYADGDVVFRAGQPDIDLYVVESGQMEIRDPPRRPPIDRGIRTGQLLRGHRHADR